MRSYQKIIISIILISAIIPILVLGQSILDLPKPGLTPNSPFYFLDTFFEKVSLVFTFNTEKKIQKAIRYSEEKLAEVKVMIEENKTESLEKATYRYQEVLSLANQKSQEVEDKKGNTGETSGLMVETEVKHQMVLESFLKESSEQTQSTIQTIIETSKTNQSQILENIPEERKIDVIDKINQLKVKIEIEQEIKDVELKIKETNKEFQETESKVEELSKKIEESKDESEKEELIAEIEKIKVEAKDLKKEVEIAKDKVETKKQEILELEPKSIINPVPIPEPIFGCIDPSANNYGTEVTKDNGSCIYSEPEPEPTPTSTPSPTPEPEPEPIIEYSDLKPTINSVIENYYNVSENPTGGPIVDILSLSDLGGRKFELRKAYFTTNGNLPSNHQFDRLYVCYSDTECNMIVNTPEPIFGDNGVYFWEGQKTIYRKSGGARVTDIQNIIIGIGVGVSETDPLEIHINLADWVLWDVSRNKQVKLEGQYTITAIKYPKPITINSDFNFNPEEAFNYAEDWSNFIINFSDLFIYNSSDIKGYRVSCDDEDYYDLGGPNHTISFKEIGNHNCSITAIDNADRETNLELNINIPEYIVVGVKSIGQDTSSPPMNYFQYNGVKTISRFLVNNKTNSDIKLNSFSYWGKIYAGVKSGYIDYLDYKGDIFNRFIISQTESGYSIKEFELASTTVPTIIDNNSVTYEDIFDLDSFNQIIPSNSYSEFDIAIQFIGLESSAGGYSWIKYNKDFSFDSQTQIFYGDIGF